LFNRNEQVHTEPVRSETGRSDVEARVPGTPLSSPRATGSPLPAGGRPLQGQVNVQPTKAPPGRSLAVQGQQSHEDEHSAGIQWAISALKQAVPFVQRLLPLIDSNMTAAMSDLVTSHAHPQQPAPRVDLAPIENGLTELQVQQGELRSQVQEQNTSLKRVEDQLEMVREATDRNTLEQQELMEDLKAVGNKVNMFALLVLALLIVSLLLNLFLFLHIQRVLP